MHDQSTASREETSALMLLSATPGMWERVAPHVAERMGGGATGHDGIDFATIARMPFSSGEVVLVDLARQCWQGVGTIGGLASVDEPSRRIVVDAIAIRLGVTQ